jgi:predicted nucleotidyltransferase component of viral defense system
MAYDLTLHNSKLKQIFQDIYADNELAAQLVFKGGTCLMFFYDIDRGSTDLDFDLRSGVDKLATSRMTKIMAKYLTVDASREKRFTYLWHGSYEPGAQGIKIEVNKRPRPQEIVFMDYKGLSVATLAPEMMFAQKLSAITTRKVIYSRDLYDANFMFEKNWSIDDQTIFESTGMETKKYLQKIVELLDDETVRKNVSYGLGEFLTRARLDWAKAKLIDSLRRQLMIKIESM